jgi:hypothetical protein
MIDHHDKLERRRRKSNSKYPPMDQSHDNHGSSINNLNDESVGPS